MREYVIFKGSRNGLQLVLDQSVEFELILENLKAKLESAVDFFTKGTKVEVLKAVRILSSEEQEDLSKVLANYGLVFYEAKEQCADEENTTFEPQEIQNLVISKTIRSGQEVIHQGSVVIEGDVNPGAKIIAGGNIVINGTCRGLVYAGAYGDSKATITAQRLLASQIRIADLIARAPDHLEDPTEAEVALIEDGTVIIKKID
ncbi:septum site-determining protein MinC [Pelosinus sp. UFO1]|uniref:septum site-determining protein MinC n=1 Tax=Pelosinus sp. UFO1 TaxID=484770 RepID=UPI0004D0B95F|nr:septum site-determining protein MinC [Pelosinus sp. UFO1]AIF52483.1 septum site-determining protein minC [Pelosinus sp. UFO1]